MEMQKECQIIAQPPRGSVGIDPPPVRPAAWPDLCYQLLGTTILGGIDVTGKSTAGRVSWR